MEKIFKSAMDKVKVEDSLNKKTRSFLVNTLLSGGEGAAASVPVRTCGRRLKKIVAAACIFVLLCGISVGAYAYYTPASYLSIDINPSVELGVNAFGKVISATAYNDDGEKILSGQDVTHMNVTDAVNVLVQSAIDNGFVVEDGSTIISITSETDSDSTSQKLQENAEEGADNAVQSCGISAGIYKDNVALERRDEARTLGITPGKLNLIQKLQALDPTISVDDYKDATVTEIMKKFVELKKASTQKDAGDFEDTTLPEDSSMPANEEISTVDTSSEKGNGNANGNSNNENGNQSTNDKQNGNGSDNGNSNRSEGSDSESAASQEDSSKDNGQGNGNGGQSQENRNQGNGNASQSQGNGNQGNGNGSGNSGSGNSNGKGNK